MFFQSIYQMITAGTDLSINIRKVENSLSVAVMPRRNNLKEDMRQNMVPLVVNGTPADHNTAAAKGGGTACQSGKFRETGRKGNGTGKDAKSFNVGTDGNERSQRKTGKDGKTH